MAAQDPANVTLVVISDYNNSFSSWLEAEELESVRFILVCLQHAVTPLVST
jgi:hypothetical protein